MATNLKEWLVRTKTRDVLGPFTQRELIEELKKNTIRIEDEIARSGGLWISAQSLQLHDLEEVTRTNTRSEIQTQSQPSTQFDEVTPTPNPFKPSIVPHSQPLTKSNPPEKKAVPLALILGTGLITTLLVSLYLISPKKDSGVALSVKTQDSMMGLGSGDSEFIRHIYSLIQKGDNQKALKELTAYHEKKLKREDLEYLIPYAALLMIEGDSPIRAKKLLEQVLSSASSKPYLKSRAHHWLGYYQLSQTEADMGESHFLEALQINTKDAAARFNLGRTYLKQERYSQALDYLQLAELEMPDLWLIHIYKGRAKAALGNMDEARVSFRNAIQSGEDRWISYIYYSLFLKQQKETEEAYFTLRKMLTRDPKFEINTPAPWGFYQEKIDYAEYLSVFSDVMEKTTSEDKEVGRLYLAYLNNNGVGIEGKKLQMHADKGGNLLSKVLALKILLEKQTVKSDEVKMAIAKLPISLNEIGHYAYVLRADAKARIGNNTEAEQDFQKALLLEPKSAVSHNGYANLLLRLQRKDEAKQEIKTLLQFYPDYIPALNFQLE